ncbi:DMT family transporter [Ramlibacter sp. PS4R-6]|uniref:DMT family transporter n=1 Tax=Ramlibacter sp. PS4R-6 TaxID=3133438 RepID=UPI0030B358DC
MHANLYALGAIALWASLAALGVSLAHVPPFLLTGLALVIGSVPAWAHVRDWRIPLATLALGIYGLFAYHFLLFMALRHAPAVEANLVNYLWPLLIVVLAPVILRGFTLHTRHVLAALAGFAGAAIAILGGGTSGGGWSWGYVAALAAAFIWSTYSLMTRRVAPFSTAAIGLFGLVSGLLALACHALFEPSVHLNTGDWVRIVIAGLGPLGAAFFLWDKALKLGDPRQIGILSYITPFASTLLLMLVTGRTPTWSIAASAALIIGAAFVGTREPQADKSAAGSSASTT